MRTRIAVLLLLASASCSPSAGYVRADKLTYDAIAPEYLRYVEADQALSDAQKQLRRDTVESWAIRIRNAGGDK